MMVIGLIGAVGAGKSFAARYLMENRGFRRRSFAAPLKDLVADQFGWDRDRLDTLEYKEEPIVLGGEPTTRREVLQYIGTETFRSLDENHWVNYARRALEVTDSFEHANIVFDDVRFPNEAEMIRAWPGGITIKVVKTGIEIAETSEAAAQHSSENALDHFVTDYVVAAEHGDLEGLYLQIADCVQAAKGD